MVDDVDRSGRDSVWSPGGGGLERWAGWLDRAREDRALQVVVVVAALVLAGVGFLVFSWLRPPDPPRAEDILPRVQLTPTTTPPTTTTTTPPVLVHVVGAVAAPGVLELPPGARVVDAITAAGGATSEADLAQVNLAAPVLDGSQIRVPVVGEPPSGPVVVGPPAASSGTGAGGPTGGPVDLNTATPTELESLPGVGPATAAAIVAWRDEHGPFTSVEQLLEVRGIGPAKFDAIREQVVVG
jgi:competence protein ComEA